MSRSEAAGNRSSARLQVVRERESAVHVALRIDLRGREARFRAADERARYDSQDPERDRNDPQHSRQDGTAHDAVDAAGRDHETADDDDPGPGQPRDPASEDVSADAELTRPDR